MFNRLQKKEIKSENLNNKEENLVSKNQQNNLEINNNKKKFLSTSFPNNNNQQNNLFSKKKKEKKKEIWDDENVIINLSMPQEIKSEGRIKRRFKIQLEYQDKNGKVHKKWIRFGKNGVQEFIDDENDERKNKLYSKLGNTHNILHPNFWRLHLLNETNDLKENWMKIINKF